MSIRQQSKKRVFDLESEILEVIGKRTTDVSSITYVEINAALVNVLRQINQEELKDYHSNSREEVTL